VVRTLGVVLSICVRRFVCENPNCAQRTFDERFEGIGRGGASERALRFFADLARGRATAAVARDLHVPPHYLRLAVGERRRRATAGRCGRLGRHLAIDECAIAKSYVRDGLLRPGARRGDRRRARQGRGGHLGLLGAVQPSERTQGTCPTATWCASSSPTR
jgi:hypothetical protein